MQQRRSFKQIDPLDKRLAEEAQRLRKEAQGTLPSVDVTGSSAERGWPKPAPAANG